MPQFTVTGLDRASILYREIKSLDRKILNARTRALKTRDEKHIRRSNSLLRVLCVARAEYHSLTSRIF